MNEFLAGILNSINGVVHNYGWAIVIFTILVKVLLFPFDYKSRKSMRKMQAIQPEVSRLQRKYANDKEKLNQKTMELYKQENVSPMAGCVPLLLSMPILFAMFGAMRLIANTELAKQAIDFLVNSAQINEGWLWVRNLWMPDSPFYAAVADQANLRQVPTEVWQTVFATLDATKVEFLAGLGEGIAITAENIDGDMIFAALSQNTAYIGQMELWATMPRVNLIFMQLNIFANPNGWFLLPLLSVATQFLLMAVQPQTMATGDAQAASTNKMMKYFMPFFSLMICFSYNAGFALYWVVSNLVACVLGYGMNKYFETQEKKKPIETIGEGSIK